MKPLRKSRAQETTPPEEVVYDLRLYVAGRTPKSVTALADLERICARYLAGRYRIEVIDLTEMPHLAAADQIVAVPTLLRKQPEPVRRIIGDLSNAARILLGLDVRSSALDPLGEL